jgi:hypothetical protein
MTEIDIADENLMKLKRLQEALLIEDSIESSVDKTLACACTIVHREPWYTNHGKFVPYKGFAL